MKLLRSAGFNLFFLGTTFVMSLVLAVRAPRTADEVLAWAQSWARRMVAAARGLCGIRLEISGLEHLPRSGAALIAAQHQSAFDTMAWLTIAPNCCFVLKRELTRIPLFGPLLIRAGMIVIDRSAGAASIRTLMRDGQLARDAGRTIVIFPEGTRAVPGDALRLHPGVAALAAATGLPVIPAATDSGRCWGRRGFWKHSGTVHLRLLPPLPAGLPRAALMAQLEEALKTASLPAITVDRFVETWPSGFASHRNSA